MFLMASFAAVCSELAGAALSVIYKNLRDAGVSTWAVGATAVYAAPFLLLAGAVLFFTQEVQLSWTYVALVLAWFFANISHNFLRIFAAKHYALSAFMVWELALSSALYFAVDVLIFDLPLSIASVFGVSLAVFGVHWAQSGSRLSQEDEPAGPVWEKPLSVWVIFCAIVVITAISAGLSKAAVSQQDTLFHAAAANGVIFLLYGALGWKSLLEARASNRINARDLVILTSAMVFLCFLEAFAFKHLPLIALRLIGVMAPFAVFIFMDIRKGRLSHDTPRTALGLLMAFIGLALFAVSVA